MATKTISLDLEAYARLKRARRDNESFSDVVKRLVREPVDLERLFSDLARLGPPSATFFSAVEQQIRARRRPSRRTR